MDRVDGRLNLIRAGLVAREALAHDRLPLGDETSIPEPAVLVGEPHELACRVGPRRAARLDEQHQREHAHRLRLVRHQIREQPSQANRLGTEIFANQLVAALAV